MINREHANVFPIFIIIALFYKQCKTANEKSRLGDDYATKKTTIVDSQGFEYDARIKYNLALFLLLEVEIIIIISYNNYRNKNKGAEKMTELKSKYWRIKLVKENAKPDWQEKIKDFPFIVSPLHTRDATADFVKHNWDHSKRLIKRYCQPDFWYLFYIGQYPKTHDDMLTLAHQLGSYYVRYISDESPIDWDLKKELRKSFKPNWGHHNYKISDFQVFGSLLWHKSEYFIHDKYNYYYYVKPCYYSKNHLITYRNWTLKCFNFLPKEPDHVMNNPYGQGNYPVYSEDTVLEIEQIPLVQQIIAKKQKRKSRAQSESGRL